MGPPYPYGRDDVEPVGVRNLSDAAREDDVAAVVEKRRPAAVQHAGGLDEASLEVGVGESEPLEQVVPGVRLDLAESQSPSPAGCCRACDRSMFIRSSTGTGSWRRTWRSVSRRILASSAKRPVLDVPGVVLEALGPRDLVAALDLRPAGDPRPDGQAPTILACVVRDLLHEVGSRPDDAHLAAEDVHELGQLVEARASQEAPLRVIRGSSGTTP